MFNKFKTNSTDGFNYKLGRVSATCHYLIREGSNKDISMSKLLDILPLPTERVKVKFIIIDKTLSGENKDKLINKNATAQLGAISYESEDGEKQIHEQNANVLITDDYVQYAKIVQSSEPIALVAIRVIIEADSRTQIEEFIESINLKYEQDFDGLKLVLSAQDASNFNNIFYLLDSPEKELTFTGQQFASFNFSLSQGINDASGLPFGLDGYSLTASSAKIDFDNSLKEYGVICMPSSSRYNKYNQKIKQPASSVIAQFIANQAVLNGSRIAHVVLNKFDYNKGHGFNVNESFFENVDKYDMNKRTINVLEGFGPIEDVVNIFSRIKSKIVNIFNIIMRYSMSDAHRALILTALEKFYFTNQLWTINADKNPKQTHITNIQNKDEYPKLTEFLNQFTSLIQRAKYEGAELKVEKLETLEGLLKDALSNYISILGRSTNIYKPKYRQSYYHLNTIESNIIKQVQLVNSIEYIASTLKEDDILILHGCDLIEVNAFNSMIELFKSLTDKGIRFIFTFDKLSSHKNEQYQKIDVSNLKGTLINDLDRDVSWSLVGTCTPDEVKMFEKLYNTEFSRTIRSSMMTKHDRLLMFHRGEDMTNAFIYSSPRI